MYTLETPLKINIFRRICCTKCRWIMRTALALAMVLHGKSGR